MTLVDNIRSILFEAGTGNCGVVYQAGEPPEECGHGPVLEELGTVNPILTALDWNLYYGVAVGLLFADSPPLSMDQIAAAATKAANTLANLNIAPARDTAT